MVEQKENHIKEEVAKSNLSAAFERKRELNLNLNIEQSLAINDILCDLANQEFAKGLDKGYEIGTKYNK